jgi:hypothetical protein
LREIIEDRFFRCNFKLFDQFCFLLCVGPFCFSTFVLFGLLDNNHVFFHVVTFRILQEANNHWNEIKNGMYWFDRKPTLASWLRTGEATQAALVQFFDRFLLASSPTRTKFSSQFFGKDKAFVKLSTAVHADNDDAAAAAKPVVVVVVQDPCLFRRTQSLLPVPAFAPL